MESFFQNKMEQYPIFINCRDRLTTTVNLVKWLESVGQERIYLVDNDSRYEPLLDWYKSTHHQVIYLNTNGGHLAPWSHGVIDKYARGQYYIATDPDVLPVDECPADALSYFHEMLQKYELRTKCGFGLKIDDIPNHFAFKDKVLQHESQYHNWLGPEPSILFAPIDTTFAMYRPNAGPDISASIRTKDPYLCRHLPWYVDTENPGEEEEYYVSRADQSINSWSHKKAPGWLS